MKFEVILLEDAFIFLSKLDIKTRKKILRNINRARYSLDPVLFKKLDNEIWEFRTLYAGIQYRLLAFWDKSKTDETLVIATHGFKKKTSKVAKKEIAKAKIIKEDYFENKDL